MATTTPSDVKVIFGRGGWMRYYKGGDERPLGGGSYNDDKIGAEAHNFLGIAGKCYGFFEPPQKSGTIALERIDPSARNLTKLGNVTVIFVATKPKVGGQAIVGWFNNATVFRQTQRNRKRGAYNCVAAENDCHLLPLQNRPENMIPVGKGGFGETNLCYWLDNKGQPKSFAWMHEAFKFIRDYELPYLSTEPEVDAEAQVSLDIENARRFSNGQGFALTYEQKNAIDKHAMAIAAKHYEGKKFKVDDVSKKRPYDLLCIKAGNSVCVEVKGTTTVGKSVVLTFNEVKHATNDSNSCILFIVHSIKIKNDKASGGVIRIFDSWKPASEHLKAISYTYTVGP